MSIQAPAPIATTLPAEARIGIVAARFNLDIVDALLTGCQQRLQQLGVDAGRVAVHRVPGAFELPLAAKAMAQTKKFAAIICLGAVIRGDTPHFEFVAGECARGIAQVALEEVMPIIFGVLTTNTHEQAIERIGGRRGHAGERAAEAAVELASLLASLRSS